MRAINTYTSQILVICLLLGIVHQQNIASGLFVSDQLLLWSGNSATQYQQSTTPYQFSGTFKSPPASLSQICAIFNGFSMLNQNRIAFNVNVLFSATSPGAYILSFTPLDTIVFYSASFSVIATTPAATGLLDLGRYYLTPTLLSNSSRTAGADQETFTLTAGMTLSNANFELRNFISCFDSYHPNGIAGLLLAPLATYTAGSDQFSVIISVEAGSSLSLCSMIAIAINKDALLVGHSEFAMTGFQVSGNFLAVANSYLSAYSSANFSIPSFYGSEMSRNCSIGFNGMKAGTDSSTKTMMVAYNSNSGSMSSSEASGGGIWGEYQVLCVVDCNSDAFYYSPLSRCDYCSTYIPYCEACSSEILCTDCGVNSFYDSISKTCRCSFGNRVTGGCTTVMACSSVDDSGICQTCKPGFTLNSSHICACPAGYSVVTNVCIDVPGCITAELIHGVPRCFSCNFSQHFQTDGNGSCLCKSGYSLLNGICVTVCGNGELFGIEQCDDGNHVSGDGCSSLCQVEKSYECNTTLDLQSVCAYKAQFAEIRLVESYRDTQENAGYFIFSVTPAIQNLNKMNFGSSTSISCNAETLVPEVEYANGVLRLKVRFLHDIEEKEMNITLKFNETIVIHKPVSSVFSIQSMNSPMLVFTKFPEYDFIELYLKALSLVAVAVFVVGSWAHKMIGVETIHIFQFVFFSCIYQVSYDDLFISSVQSLRFSSNYPDLYFNQKNSIKEGDIFQSLMFAYTFVGNYYITGTLELVLLFLFIGLLLAKNLKAQERLGEGEGENDWQLAFALDYEKKNEYVYSMAFFPLVVGYYFQCFFAVEAQLYRKSEGLSRFELVSNSLLSILFVWLTATTVFREIFFNLRQSVKSVFYNVQNQYIVVYIINILVNLVFFNFSDRFQYDLTSFVAYNFAYFLVILAYRPYSHALHNFHIIFNQLLFLLWIVFLIYQDRAESKLSDDQKFYVLAALISALSLTLLIAILRILIEVLANGSQKRKIDKYYADQLARKQHLRLKSDRKLRKILNNDLANMEKYRVVDQVLHEREVAHQLVNATRNALGLKNLFESPKEAKRKRGPELERENTMIVREQFSSNHVESHKSRKEAEIGELKMRLRENLLKYKKRQGELHEEE